jgi:hypothetical protein
MIETKVNLSRLAFDGLRTVAIRTPLVKRLYPVINTITTLVEELLPLEMYLQVGHQHSESVNFNDVQEQQRSTIMEVHNLRIRHGIHVLHRVYRPLNRHTLVTNQEEIHARSFYAARFMVTYNFSILDILERLTANKNKSSS